LPPEREHLVELIAADDDRADLQFVDHAYPGPSDSFRISPPPVCAKRNVSVPLVSLRSFSTVTARL
jgi:hypothetical protein